MDGISVISKLCAYFGSKLKNDSFTVVSDGFNYPSALIQCHLFDATKKLDLIKKQYSGTFAYREFGIDPFSELMPHHGVPEGYSKEELFYMYPIPGNNNNSYNTSYLDLMYEVKLPQIRRKFPSYPVFFENFDGKVYCCLLLKAEAFLNNLCDSLIFNVLDAMRNILYEL